MELDDLSTYFLNGAWVPEGPVPCSSDPDSWSDGKVYKDPATLAYSRSVCRRECPFKIECLETAMREEGDTPAQHRFGIRGGLLPKQRYSLYKTRKIEHSLL